MNGEGRRRGEPVGGAPGRSAVQKRKRVDTASGSGALASGQPLPRHLQGHIGKQLRAAYTELVNEPVPDKISELLEQLKAAETGGAKE